MILTRLGLRALGCLVGTVASVVDAGAQASGAIEAGSGFAEHSDRGWQTSGALTAAYQLKLAGALSAELTGMGAWSRTSWGRGAGGALSEARLLLSGPSRGVSLSAGVGRAFPAGPSEGFSRVEARTWSRMAGLSLGFSLRRTGVTAPGSTDQARDNNPPLEDTLPLGAGAGIARKIQDHYTDFNATIGWSRNAYELEAGLGRRFGQPVNQYTSWRITASYWLTEGLALVGSAGRFPADVVSGLPSGNYALLSLRISWKDGSMPSRASRPARLPRRFSAFEATRTSVGHIALGVWAPSAERVEVMGSFNDWRPVELLGGDAGWWHTELALAPGLYEINVRINGGPWYVPAGVRSVDDGFGGSVGVFTVGTEDEPD